MSKNILSEFNDAFAQQLSFLLTDYSFKEISVESSETVLHKKLESDSVIIEIIISHWELEFVIFPKNKIKYVNKGFDFLEIINFLAPNEYTGNILKYNRDISAYECFSKKFNEISLLCKKYCIPIIKGDFNLWPQLDILRSKINKQFYKN